MTDETAAVILFVEYLATDDPVWLGRAWDVMVEREAEKAVALGRSAIRAAR